MAATFRLSHGAANACAGDGANNGLSAFIGSSCILRFYAGGVNTNPESAPAGTLLSTSGNVMTGDDFGTGTNGVLTGGTVDDDTAVASGTAASAWLTKSDGTTPVADMNAGTADTTVVFDNNVFVAGGTISISSFTITVPSY